MEDNAEVQYTRPKISRRDFLKWGGTTAAGVVAGYAAWRLGLKSGGTESTPSPETELKPSVKVLDFFDVGEAKDEYLQNNFPPNFSEEKSWQEMGVDDPSSREGLLKATPKDENQARLLMMTFFQHQYRNHGNDVVTVMEEVSGLVSPDQKTVSPARSSIAGAVGFGRLEYDEIGNPTIHVTLSSDAVDRLVSETPESVVNMSFELGDFSLTYYLYGTRDKYPEYDDKDKPIRTVKVGSTTSYFFGEEEISEERYNEIQRLSDEKEIVLLEPDRRDVDYLDGYAGGETYNNLLKLTGVARKHPEKVFVAAGGNPTTDQKGIRIPDIEEARLKLEEQGLWPNNLIIVGFTGYPGVGFGFAVDHEVRASYGADIYVTSKDLKELGFQGASSYATPVVTEIIRQLVANRLNTYKKAKEVLIQMTDVKEAWRGSRKTVYRVLNLNKAIAIITIDNLRRGK